MQKSKFYLTTAIAYTNGKPHLGHALEFILADAISRYQKLAGQETYFQTGTDEFGSKMADTAKELGLSPQELADQNSEFFREIMGELGVEADYFMRTSSEQHILGAQSLWEKMVANDDIYKGTYKGLYCSGCEAYLAEKDLDENGVCPNHLKKPQLIEEVNYFFRLSKFNAEIRRLIETDELKIYPESRKNEMLALVNSEDGLMDISFSRPKEALAWGVPVPNDPDHVMYVWCDALSNYITGLGYRENSDLFQSCWPADLQIIGKDILRFHAGIWIGMLLSAGLKPPKAILVHGFITSEGQKMSKSLGNVVDPKAIVSEFGQDAFRYYLLKEIPTTDDGDFTVNRFVEIYEADLANNIGNLLSRVLTLLAKHNDGQVVDFACNLSCQEIKTRVEAYKSHFANYEIKKACEEVLKLANYANKYVEDHKPWELAKTDKDAAVKLLSNLVNIIRVVAIMLNPIIPIASQKILTSLGLDGKINLSDYEVPLPAGTATIRGENLFPKRSS